MLLDVATLMFINAFVAAVSGTLLVLAWSAYRDMTPVLRWAGASYLQSLGLAFLPLSGMLSLGALHPIGLSCVVGSAALLWHSVRLIEGHGPSRILALAGPLVVFAAILAAGQDQLLGTQVAMLAMAAYLMGAGWIVGQSEQWLGSRWPLALLLGAYAFCLAIAALVAPGLGGTSLAGGAIILVLSGNVFFLIGTTIFVVAGMRERGELGQRKLAMLDSLTGLYNRGSFFALAEAAAARCLRNSRPLSLAILDLDHFKRVNDDFGHATGDHALLIFGDCARRALPPGSILGRIGGEEFALLLPEVDGAGAHSVVEDIRRRFETDAKLVGGQAINATLSAGIAWSPAGNTVMADLMRAADGALYEAKAGGRNRVSLAGDATPENQALVVRVA